MNVQRAIYRFTRDLRIDDHAGLAIAAAIGEVVAVLVIDRPLEERLRSSPRRAAFFCSCVAALNAAIHERGGTLIVRRGSAASVLRRIARAVNATAVCWSASYDRAGCEADQHLASELEESGLQARIAHDAPAIPPEETSAARPSAGEGYRAFAPYYELWRECVPASHEIPLLLAFAHNDLQSEPFPVPAEFGSTMQCPAAGSAHAAGRLREFLEGPALQYAIAANVPADDRTSHLGADLSFGCIAARTVLREVRSRMDDPFLLVEERQSLRLFLRSLALRDFFLQLAWYHPLTSREPLQEKMRAFPISRSHPLLDAWRSGRTGYPIVDAGVRQLQETGWMHPRVRAIAASFLCFDLGVDWRIGMAEWNAHLIEDDPALAIGNWQWVAGVGADLAAYPRIYNPTKQAHRFDPKFVYARRWIAELAEIPAAAIGHSPAGSAQIDLPLFGTQRYPAPVLDHEKEAQAFLMRYRDFMQASDRPASR